MRRRRTALPLRTFVTGTVLAVLGALLTLLAPPATAAPAAAPTAVRGGDVLYGTSGACTVGFNAVRGSASYAIVLGHCVNANGSTWWADPGRTVQVGVTAGMSFPGNDYAIIRYTNTSLSYPGEVKGGGGQPVDITGTADPVPGQAMCHYGRVTGFHCGIVQAVNVTVSFPGGVVYGLFRSNICSEPGDVGGPAFSGDKALGLIVGGSGNCVSGGTTFYQPIKEILAVYGLTLA